MQNSYCDPRAQCPGFSVRMARLPWPEEPLQFKTPETPRFSPSLGALGGASRAGWARPIWAGLTRESVSVGLKRGPAGLGCLGGSRTERQMRDRRKKPTGPSFRDGGSEGLVAMYSASRTCPDPGARGARGKYKAKTRALWLQGRGPGDTCAVSTGSCVSAFCPPSLSLSPSHSEPWYPLPAMPLSYTHASPRPWPRLTLPHSDSPFRPRRDCCFREGGEQARPSRET